MTRFRFLLLAELKLARTALPIHLIALLQPCAFFLLLSLVWVQPTFDMNVVRPESEEGRALVQAMREVRTPDDVPYINPVELAPEEVVQADGSPLRQVVVVESRDGRATALQRFGLIDSNQIKNLRNRLTAAALRLWDDALGDRAVTIEEHTWLPHDVPYIVYFGMAMLPLTVFLAANFIGGTLTAQDFEYGTILEYRLASAGALLTLTVRVARLVLTALLAAGLLLLTQGWHSGFWPESVWRVGLILLPVATVGSCVGIITGLLLRRSIPTLALSLLVALGSWIVGGAFGLAAGFGGLYELVGRVVPHTYAVELLFGVYYGTVVGTPWLSVLLLALFSGGSLLLTLLVYRWRVRQPG